RQVVIAWNGSLEGARAISLSLPLLHAAEKDSIFTAPTAKSREGSLADARSYLRWHGIIAEVAMAPPTEHSSVGEALLTACQKIDATLLVMGAYTRSRLQESFL